MENKKDSINNTEGQVIVNKVLDLQFYNLPFFKICQMLDLTESQIDSIMTDNGYIKILDKYVVKPKPQKKEKVKKTTKKRTKKEKTPEELLEAEYKRNPAKRGFMDPTGEYLIINKQAENIIENNLKGLSLGEIAKLEKMTKPGLLEFMESKGLFYQNGKFIGYEDTPEYLEKKRIENEKRKQEEEARRKQEEEDRREELEYQKFIKAKIKFWKKMQTKRRDKPEPELLCFEEEFNVILKEFETMYNWYISIKDNDIFKK